MNTTTKSRPAMPVRIIKTKRPWYDWIWRRVMIAYLEWCETSIRQERERYIQDRYPIGPRYLENSYALEEILRVRIADLRNG